MSKIPMDTVLNQAIQLVQQLHQDPAKLLTTTTIKNKNALDVLKAVSVAQTVILVLVVQCISTIIIFLIYVMKNVEMD